MSMEERETGKEQQAINDNHEGTSKTFGYDRNKVFIGISVAAVIIALVLIIVFFGNIIWTAIKLILGAAVLGIIAYGIFLTNSKKFLAGWYAYITLSIWIWLMVLAFTLPQGGEAQKDPNLNVAAFSVILPLAVGISVWIKRGRIAEANRQAAWEAMTQQEKDATKEYHRELAAINAEEEIRKQAEEGPY